MKILKLRQFAVAAFAVGALALGGGQLAAQAKSTAPDTVTMKLHKLDNQAGESIPNTGAEVDTQGLQAYDADQFGAVTYSVFDITQLFAKANTAAEFKELRDKLIGEMTADNDQKDPAKLLEKQTEFINKHNLTATATQTLRGKEGLLTFADQKNQGVFLILETAAETANLFQISAPIIVALPLNDKDTIHLYPKNVTAQNIDPTIEKLGIDPEAPLSGEKVILPGVVFTLAKADSPENIITKMTTDEDGDFDFGGLAIGEKYILKEHSVEEYPWYSQDDVNAGEISITFSVDKAGNIMEWTATPSKNYFKVSGDTITLTNYLILGGAQFKKVDSQSKKGLSGAKFKVQKVVDGKMFWAIFNDQHVFAQWTTSKDEGTTLTSGSDGTFDFTGVPYVYDQRDHKTVQYNLIETQAPAGYALLKEATPFKINETTELMTIENERYALPITGGMGIWLFLLIGGLLMGGAGYLYYRQRQRS